MYMQTLQIAGECLMLAKHCSKIQYTHNVTVINIHELLWIWWQKFGHPRHTSVAGKQSPSNQNLFRYLSNYPWRLFDTHSRLKTGQNTLALGGWIQVRIVDKKLLYCIRNCNDPLNVYAPLGKFTHDIVITVEPS